MILDGIILLIVLFFGVYGLRKGFMYTFIHTAGWIISLILAFIATPYSQTFIRKHTSIYEFFESLIPLPAGSPTVIQDLTYFISTEMVFTIITYLVLVLAIKALTTLFLRLFSSPFKKGPIGCIDNFFGLLVGLLKGLLLVFIFLACVIPIADIFIPEVVPSIIDSLNNSFYARTLYDNNFLLLLLQDFFEIPTI